MPTAELLSEFLANNPISSITSRDSAPGKPSEFIVKPWGDSTLNIRIPDDSADLFNALNATYFPERLTAIYHREERSLEIIWTAYRLPDDYGDIVNRKFLFNLASVSVECEFGRSSNELLEIAKHCVPVSSASNTNFRNVMSFSRYSREKDLEKSSSGVDEPISFWVKGLDFQEDEVINLLRNLNFHLLYHDTRSPVINIQILEMWMKNPYKRFAIYSMSFHL